MKLTCPVCGSSDVETGTEKRTLTVPYGPSVTVSEVVHSCRACGTRADFTDANRGVVRAALAKAEAESALQMLSDLAEQGVTSAYLERALRLPPRTTNRWKDGELSAGALALLRMVRTYPWLLQVADADFSREAAAAGLASARRQHSRSLA